MKVISFIVLLIFITYYAITGAYDPFSLTSTADIKLNYSNYINKTVKIQQVSILESEIVKQEGKDFLIKFTIYNGNILSLYKKTDSIDFQKHKDKSIVAYAWIEEKSELLEDINTTVSIRFSFLKLKIEKDYIAISKYSLSDVEENWLLAPYTLSFILLNLFLSLTISVIIASIIQIIVIWIITRLVIEGVVYVLPEF